MSFHRPRRWVWIVAGTLSAVWIVVAFLFVTANPSEPERPVVADPPRKPRPMPTVETEPTPRVLSSFEERGESTPAGRPADRAVMKSFSSKGPQGRK